MPNLLNKILRGLGLLILTLVVALPVSQADAKTTIRMGDFSWDSVQLHNRIVGYVLEHGLGYNVEYDFAESMPILMGMSRGDVDATTEIWSDNLRETWSKMLDKGTVIDLGSNYPDAIQGWYVPAYVVKGDPARGIAPVAPDLKTVMDLKKYKDLFLPETGGDKGRFYNGPTGWVTYSVNAGKLKSYGLDKLYDNFSAGSSAALATVIFSAYEKGKPILAYYWEPTPLMGMLDMIKLEEPPYRSEEWENKTYKCDFPPSKVHVAVGTHMFKKAPQAVSILANYTTTLEQTNAALAYMKKNNATMEEAAIWFLRQYPLQWSNWFPITGDERIEKVQKALNKES